jgi:hypothetical protein
MSGEDAVEGGLSSFSLAVVPFLSSFFFFCFFFVIFFSTCALALAWGVPPASQIRQSRASGAMSKIGS